MTSTSPRICVIGGGIIGSWTALHLAETGAETILIEQYPLPHGRGSSHGASRAFRYLGDETVDRLVDSLDRWQALEALAGETLFVPTGLLNFGPPGDPWLDHHMAVLHDAGKPCEWLDAADIRSRFPHVRYPDEWGAAWDPNGGILYAHRCLSAVQGRFRRLGGTIVTARAERVRGHADQTASIRIRRPGVSTAESLHCAAVVVTCGPWTSALLPELRRLLKTSAIPVTYWRDPSGRCSVARGFPILYNARLTDIYALPACEYHDLVKVLYHGGPESEPETRDVPDRGPYVDRVRRYVRRHLPALDAEGPALEETCMYTHSPDGEPILDRLGENVVVGCGFSGSGFKHSPATGRMLAALALGEEAELPEGYRLPRYRRSRFNDTRQSDDGTPTR